MPIEYRKLADKLTGEIAAALHYQDRQDSLDMSTMTAADVREMTEGGQARYLSQDWQFKARVDQMVAHVLSAVQDAERG